MTCSSFFWTRSATALAPKVNGATSLAKFPLIAGRCAMRESMGDLWLDTLSASVCADVTCRHRLVPLTESKRVDTRMGALLDFVRQSRRAGE